MALILTDEQKVKLSVGFFTKAGNPAKIDGLPTWASSDPSIITVTVSEDGLSADAVTAGPLGTVQVTVSADADLGEGTRLITGVLDIEVRAAEAVSANIAAGTPESK
jgi:hypothetical protein